MPDPIPDFNTDLGTLKRWTGEAASFLSDVSRAFPDADDSDQASLVGGLRWKGSPSPFQMRSALEYLVRAIEEGRLQPPTP